MTTDIAADRARSRGRRPVIRALVAVALIGAAVAIPAQASAVEGLATTTSSTFELIPEDGLVRVTVVLSVTNLSPSTTSGNVITDYYFNEGGFYVDPSGTNYRVSTAGGSASVTVEGGEEGFLSFAVVSFPNTFYRQTRTVTVVYDIPGGAPRSENQTRAGMAYASFCGFPGGAYPGDPESLRLVLPDRYTVAPLDEADLDVSSVDGKTVLGSGENPTSSGTDWNGACVEGHDPGAFASSEHTSHGGIAVSTEAWPEDAEWQAAVADQAGPTLDALEEVIGRSADADAITVQEVIGESLGGYIGTFDPETGTARVSEDGLDLVVAAHELAHAWFNDSFSPERWLSEGYAEYYGRLVADEPPCPVPDTEAMDLVRLSDWTFLPPQPTDEEFALVDAQYDTACWVVTSVAGKAGADAMQEIFAAAEDGEIAYLGSTPPELTEAGPITWQEWLDLVDERGLVPSGDTDLTWLQELLVDLGAAPNTYTLLDRADARAAYHDLRGQTGSWDTPIAIRSPMADWEFDEATDAIAVAGDLDAAHDAATVLVPELTGSSVVEDAYEASEDAADLTATDEIATAELEASDNVAAAVTAAEVERNPIESLGLVGEDLAAGAVSAVDSLVEGEFDEAASTADAVVATGTNAALNGALRLGGALLAVAALILGIWWIRRRSSTASAAATLDPDDSSGGA